MTKTDSEIVEVIRSMKLKRLHGADDRKTSWFSDVLPEDVIDDLEAAGYAITPIDGDSVGVPTHELMPFVNYGRVLAGQQTRPDKVLLELFDLSITIGDFIALFNALPATGDSEEMEQ